MPTEGALLPARLTIQDIAQALGTEQVFQAADLVLQLAHEFVVGVLVDDGVALDLLGTVCIPVGEEERGDDRWVNSGGGDVG